MNDARLLRNEILACIARLMTMSHVAATDYEARGLQGGPATDDDPGGRRPNGGIDRRDDKEPEFHLRSAEHFIRRLARAHNEGALRAILHDAELAVNAWTHTPVPRSPGPEQEPERGSFRWKCAIADDDRAVVKVKAHYMVSESTITRYRSTYRGVVQRRAA